MRSSSFLSSGSMKRNSFLIHNKKTFDGRLNAALPRLLFSSSSPSYSMPKPVSAEEALTAIQSNSRVFIHSAAGAPEHLLQKMVETRAGKVKDVTFVGLHLEGKAPHLRPEYSDSFKTHSFFMSANERGPYARGTLDYIPVFLSEIPSLFYRNILPLDVALLQITPPDKDGLCSLGVSVDCSLPAFKTAKKVIFQMNRKYPRTSGDALIRLRESDLVVEHDEEIPEHAVGKVTETDRLIASHLAPLVPNRACLQLGVGNIPNAVLEALSDHKDLGVHTETFSDGVVNLIEKGVITNKYKSIDPGYTLTSFVLGSKKLYDHINNNPLVLFKDSSFVNNPGVILQNKATVSINSAIEVDITGQVCADSIGTRQYSGVGGQVDFVRGATLSEDGKSIIALHSTTRRGESKIVSMLAPGAGVVTTRAHVHYIVTEYGVANLLGKTLRQRARALINIAHPDHRESLTEQAVQRFGSLTSC